MDRGLLWVFKTLSTKSNLFHDIPRHALPFPQCSWGQHMDGKLLTAVIKPRPRTHTKGEEVSPFKTVLRNYFACSWSRGALLFLTFGGGNGSARPAFNAAHWSTKAFARKGTCATVLSCESKWPLHRTPFFTWKNDWKTNYGYSDSGDLPVILLTWTKWTCHFKESNWQHLFPVLKYELSNKIQNFENQSQQWT